jgi:hypothetical protein
MHKKFIRNSFTKNQKCIKTANKNAKEVKGIQENFNRHAKGMHQNFRRNSQENIAIVSKKMMKKWNASGISLKIMLLFLCTLHALSTA